jgi:hypothetical protein
MRSFCASVPPRAINCAPMPTVARYGSTISASPIASITGIESTAPLPKPPCSLGRQRPVRPSSAIVFHASRLHPSGEPTILRRVSKS